MAGHLSQATLSGFKGELRESVAGSRPKAAQSTTFTSQMSAGC